MFAWTEVSRFHGKLGQNKLIPSRTRKSDLKWGCEVIADEEQVGGRGGNVSGKWTGRVMEKSKIEIE